MSNVEHYPDALAAAHASLRQRRRDTDDMAASFGSDSVSRHDGREGGIGGLGATSINIPRRRRSPPPSHGTHDPTSRALPMSVSRVYCILSASIAFLAVVLSSSPFGGSVGSGNSISSDAALVDTVTGNSTASQSSRELGNILHSTAETDAKRKGSSSLPTLHLPGASGGAVDLAVDALATGLDTAGKNGAGRKESETAKKKEWKDWYEKKEKKQRNKADGIQLEPSILVTSVSEYLTRWDGIVVACNESLREFDQWMRGSGLPWSRRRGKEEDEDEEVKGNFWKSIFHQGGKSSSSSSESFPLVKKSRGGKKWGKGLNRERRHKRKKRGGKMNDQTDIDEEDATGRAGSVRMIRKRRSLLARLLSGIARLVDPSLVRPDRLADPVRAATDVIDKILTSTPRIMSIANFLLAVTYLLHGLVADYFLGGSNRTRSITAGRRNSWAGGVGDNGGFLGTGTEAVTPTNARNQQRLRRSGGTGATAPGGRERLGAFLIFKLLLLSSVLSPDTLDMLILLAWYTLLSFLRSLAHLSSHTITHTAQSGLPPSHGALKLLLVVLACNATSAVGCVGLFFHAGMGMVLLLVMDCVVLMVDVAGHVVRYATQILEEKHAVKMSVLEGRQMMVVHGSSVAPETATGRNNDEDNLRRNGTDREGGNVFINNRPNASIEAAHVTITDSSNNDGDVVLEEIDREIEFLESRHTRRLALLEWVVFQCEIASAVLTACHFCHIWYLHGLGFGLVDGVLALHLHSSVSSVRRKIAERRNFQRIAQDLDGLFEDASESEMRKAHSSGDLCSVCLRPMMSANVKKLRCNHLYHSHCLMEVVERARSLEAARCPLCRSSVVEGSSSRAVTHGRVTQTAAAVGGGGVAPNGANAPHLPTAGGGTDTVVEDVNAGGTANEMTPADVTRRMAVAAAAAAANQAAVAAVRDEDSLFRFSTEGIIPAWLPIPAFSFEVVRRSPPSPVGFVDNAPDTAPQQEHQQQQMAEQQQEQQPLVNAANGNVTRATGNDVAVAAVGDNIGENGGGNGSFLLRLLHLTGAVRPMSEEEEDAALIQLVEMFPQYDRGDLLRGLRQRGAAELVAESILMGTFDGMVRVADGMAGDGFVDDS